MGLLTIIRKVKRKEREMRFLMVGLDNAGKTTVVKSLQKEDTSTVSPTLGFSIKTLQYKGFQLNIWDVGGQKSLRAYWRNYFEQTDALIWVVDSADVQRLEDCRAELHRLLQEERLAGASLLVLANKQDISGALVEAQLQEVQLLAGSDRVSLMQARSGDSKLSVGARAPTDGQQALESGRLQRCDGCRGV